jgi:hypothetical protein
MHHMANQQRQQRRVSNHQPCLDLHRSSPQVQQEAVAVAVQQLTSAASDWKRLKPSAWALHLLLLLLLRIHLRRGHHLRRSSPCRSSSVAKQVACSP